MKTVLSFIGFVSASVLAGIGIEDHNNLAMVAGVFFMMLTVLLVMSESEEVIKSRNNENS